MDRVKDPHWAGLAATDGEDSSFVSGSSTPLSGRDPGTTGLMDSPIAASKARAMGLDDGLCLRISAIPSW